MKKRGGVRGGVSNWLSHSFSLFCSSIELAERGREKKGRLDSVFARTAQCYYRRGFHSFPLLSLLQALTCTSNVNCFPIHWRVLVKRSGQGRRSLCTFRSSSPWTQSSNTAEPQVRLIPEVVPSGRWTASDCCSTIWWGLQTLHCGNWDAESSPRIAQSVLPKMSSQAKVKKDKEIIAEYETQVKGW